jgi:hypothetical protein
MEGSLRSDLVERRFAPTSMQPTTQKAITPLQIQSDQNVMERDCQLTVAYTGR